MANVTNLTPLPKGKRSVGRAPGVKNRVTRILKKAIIDAAEKSEHSVDGSLEGYCLFLANQHPPQFAALLGKLIPVQMRAKLEASTHPDDLVLDTTMSLTTMMEIFEEKIKSGYTPPPRPRPSLIEQVIDDDDDDSDDDD